MNNPKPAILYVEDDDGVRQKLINFWATCKSKPQIIEKSA